MQDSKKMICKLCKEEKPIKSFCHNKNKDGTLHYWDTCQTCHSREWRLKNKDRSRLYNREYRKSHPDKNDKTRRRNKRLERKKLLLEKLNVSKCQRCGNDDFRVLCFHHRDPSKKESSILGGNYQFQVLEEEIKKCDVLCHNCHAIIHYEQYDQLSAVIANKRLKGKANVLDNLS